MRISSKMFLSALLFIAQVNGAVNYSAAEGYNNSDFYTNGEHLFVTSHLKKSSIIFDVGANVGEWSLIAAENAPLSKIYAFEPHPDIFKILERTLLSVEGAKCFNMGLSDTTKESELYVWGNINDLEKSVLNGFYYRPLLKDLLNINCSQVNATATSLDIFCNEQNIKHIDFLKIDTEGSEWDVLVGAKNMISAGSIDIIQFEYGGCYIDSHIKLEDIFYFLKESGYSIYRLLPHNLREIAEWDEELENYQYSNYAAIFHQINYENK